MTRYIDTNVLVRLLTNDIPSLAQEAVTRVEQCIPGEVLVLDAALVELFFVLEHHQAYMLPRRALVTAFTEGVLATPQLQVSALARAAFELFAQHPKLDFTDCLLLAAGQRTGDRLITFDKDLLKAAA